MNVNVCQLLCVCNYCCYYCCCLGKVYWMILVLQRKFWIAFAGLMFHSNPSFQLSFVCLILFTAFVLQVKNRPL